MGSTNHSSEELWAANSNVSAVVIPVLPVCPTHEVLSAYAAHGGCSVQLHAYEEGDTPRIQPKVRQGLSRWKAWLLLSCMADALVGWWVVVE
jgi:hypothetical protein